MSRLPPIPDPLDCVLFDAGDTLLAPAPSFQGRFVAVAAANGLPLEELAGWGVKLGVVSNFEPWLEDVLALQEVDHLFAAVAISGKLGVAKPDPEIFQWAIREAGANPGATVHVGDQPVNDVDAARAVGITPVLIDRFARYPEPNGSHRVESLLGLIELVSGNGSP